LFSTLDEVKKGVASSSAPDKEEILHVVMASIDDIFEWQRHIIRGNQQDLGKQKMLENLNSQTAYWLRDWGMKMMPQKYRETMTDWFGKRGISNHMDCVFTVNDHGEIQKVTYVTLIDNCAQDTYGVLCVFEHVLKQVLQDFPHIKYIMDRSDNAGYVYFSN
jgi:hypothetical protein